ncbi:MAG: LysM peptidoglycan-binding domain-containing protein [Actinobacteria bacterium]|nr:LysM peptidoglycan-binding domain-containing protein [Actinomycetota bacterium]
MRYRERTLLRGFGALVALLVVVVGVPALLVRFVGWPLPTALPTWAQFSNAITSGNIDDATIIKTLAVVVWLAWLNFSIGASVELASLVRGGRARRVAGLRSAQRLAANLLTATSLAVAMLTRSAAGVGAAPPTPSLTAASALIEQPQPSTTGGSDHDPGSTRPERGAASSGRGADEVAGAWTSYVPYNVERGDTLWRLAERFLGDGLRWREIRDRNIGRVQPDGTKLAAGSTDLRPGWTLLVPASDASAERPPSVRDDPSSTVTVDRGDTLWDLADEHLDDPLRWTEMYERNRGVPQPDGDALTEPDLIQPGWVLTLPEAGPGEESVGTLGIGDAGEVRDVTEPSPHREGPVVPDALDRARATPPAGRWEPRPVTPTSGASPQETGAASPVDEVEDSSEDSSEDSAIAVTAGGAIAAGLILTLDRIRRARRRRRRPDHRIPLPDGQDAAAERFLRVHADHDTATFVDLALRHLADGCGGRPSPAVTLVLCGQDDVTVHLDAPSEDVPEGWLASGDSTWVIERPDNLDALAQHKATPSLFPVLVTVGSTPDGRAALVNLAGRDPLGVHGDPDRAAELMAVWALELATTPRVDALEVLTVGIDGLPADLERLTPLTDADDLHAELARRPVTGEVEAPSLVVLANGVDDEAEAAVRAASEKREDLVAVISRSCSPTTRRHTEITGNTAVLHPAGLAVELVELGISDLASVGRLLDQAKNDPELPVPLSALGDDDHEAGSSDTPVGEVDVRVLGPVDVIGVDRFPTNKTMELVAYLAMHRDGATTDMLLEALWPNHEPRPARLYTEASRARKALGTRADGSPYLPDAELGRYRIADAVTSDYERFSAHVAAATRDPDLADQHLREALTLVRGAPFSATATAYTWAHQLEIRISEEIVTAAHDLAHQMLDSARYEDAVWAAERGLSVNPLAEPLIRVLMIAADATGNTARVHEVMARLRETLAEDDANDADDWLHPETITLFERLSRRPVPID